MAAYRKRWTNWRVELIVKGQRISGTFSTKREAQAWAVRAETRLRESAVGEIPDHLPVRDLLERYSREVSARKRGCVRERMGNNRCSTYRPLFLMRCSEKRKNER